MSVGAGMGKVGHTVAYKDQSMDMNGDMDQKVGVARSWVGRSLAQADVEFSVGLGRMWDSKAPEASRVVLSTSAIKPMSSASCCPGFSPCLHHKPPWTLFWIQWSSSRVYQSAAAPQSLQTAAQLQ